MELADLLKSYWVDIPCIQETWWKGGKLREIGLRNNLELLLRGLRGQFIKTASATVLVSLQVTCSISQAILDLYLYVVHRYLRKGCSMGRVYCCGCSVAQHVGSHVATPPHFSSGSKRGVF